MSVELEYNGERYMVENGQWYRRLKVGERLSEECQIICNGAWMVLGKTGIKAFRTSVERLSAERDDWYRVPCVDPRPPFKVGDRVKVARKDESWEHWCEEMHELVDDPREWIVTEIECKALTIEDETEAWSFPPWCLDLIEPAKPELTVAEKIKQGAAVVDTWPEWKQNLFPRTESYDDYLPEPAKPTVGQTIIERLTKHVEKTEQETAKVMKFRQWQLRPVKEPKTLADVPSSMDRPVMCWVSLNSMSLVYATPDGVVSICHNGKVSPIAGAPSNFALYQPSTTAYTLNTLPDYRVVLCDGMAYFRRDGEWFDALLNEPEPDGFDSAVTGPSGDFTVTPYEAYLAEVEQGGE